MQQKTLIYKRFSQVSYLSVEFCSGSTHPDIPDTKVWGLRCARHFMFIRLLAGIVVVSGRL